MQAPVGLTDAEATARRRRGEANEAVPSTGRGYLGILRANLFTFFNNILFTIGAALIVLGRPGDAIVSVGIGLLSAVISSVQEVLGRRRLDKLRVIDDDGVAVLRRDKESRDTGRRDTGRGDTGRGDTGGRDTDSGNTRDGDTERRVPPADVVRGDLLPLVPGAQIVVDGPLVTGRIEADESLITGEADPVLKGIGDRLLSGSTCVSGAGIQCAEAVGAQSYAGRLTAAARTESHDRTPLQRQVDLLIRLIMLTVGVVGGAILAEAALGGQTLVRFVQTAAVLSGLVPYGLFLLITVAYTGGAATIARRGVLVQQVGAVEAMSNVDVLCADKTGTLTGAALELTFLDVLPGADPDTTAALLGGLARNTPAPGPVGEALAAAVAGEPVPVLDEVPFSPDLRWRSIATGSGVVVIGAPDALAAAMTPADRAGPLAELVARRTSAGLRVLVLARSVDPAAPLRDIAGCPALPALVPLAVVSLREELRPGVVEAVAGLRTQGVTFKVLSGDDPRTVAGIAVAAGIDAGEPVSGPELDVVAPEVFDRVVAQHNVFGHLSPEQKERVVASLRRRGRLRRDDRRRRQRRRRAQTGAGRRRDGSGSPVTRDVADVVLVTDSFEALLPAQHAGMRIIGGSSRRCTCS